MIDAPRPARPANVRDALIDAGLALLKDEGRAGLTLRRAAALAGVSHAAPAHHFDGLSGLLTAIATRAYAIFTAYIDRAKPGAPPFEALVQVCDGYLDFARDHDGLFHLLFVSAEVDRADPGLGQAGAAAYEVLSRACLPFSASGTPDPTIEIAVWSAVHGYAQLGLTQPDSPKRAVVAIPPFRAVLAQVLGRSE